MTITYVVGRLSFIDTPKIFDEGANVEGKVSVMEFSSLVWFYAQCVRLYWTFSLINVCFQQVKAVHYNNTPIPDMAVYLFEGERWSTRRIENLTTNSDGIATFSFDTANLKRDIKLHVSKKQPYSYLSNICQSQQNAFMKILMQSWSSNLKHAVHYVYIWTFLLAVKTEAL